MAMSGAPAVEGRRDRRIAVWRCVVRKEMLEILRSPKFAWTFGVCSVLILLAFYVGARGWILEQQRWEAGREEGLRQLEGETEWLEVAVTQSLPPQPLAGLVGGVAHDLGRHARIEGRGSIRTWGSRFGSDPVFAVFRFLDLDFVFRIVLSLFALLFSFDAVCGEKERGTLRLCFSHAISRAAYLGGKIAGSTLALLVPLLVPVALGIGVWIALGVPLAGSDVARIAMVVAVGFLYVTCFLSLAVWISTLTTRSSSAFLLLLAIWVLLVLVLPRAAVALAARQVEVLSVDEIDAESSRLRSQLWEADRRDLHTTLPALARATSDPLEVRMQRINRYLEEQATARDEKLGERTRGLIERRRNQQRRQRRLALGLARISPAASFHLASMELAGTSLALEDRFLDELTRYQATFSDFQAEKSGGRRAGSGIQIRIDDGSGDGAADAPQPIDPRELPEFTYHPPPIGADVVGALPDLALLLAFSLLFFIASFVAFLRYDLR